jgi:hypothetical protein
MADPPQLLLDLGDLLTKGLYLGPDGRRLLRFPSAVARRLLDPRTGAGELLLGEPHGLLRPDGFMAGDYPRFRSFPGGRELVTELGADARPLSGARFVGWLAAAYGEDRRLLGAEPTPDQIDALVRRALLLTATSESESELELVLLVDLGPKADALVRYVRELPPRVTIHAWSALTARPLRVELALRASVLDAAECAMAALPAELEGERNGRWLLCDIGYRRTKLAIVSARGCEHQEQLDGIGVHDCVRRILSDGQEQGLVEDELAVIRALERGEPALEVAGLSFDVSRTLADASRALVDELARGVERTLVDDFVRRGEACRGLAILGGGAALVGSALAARLEGSELRLATSWVAPAPSFTLLEGAVRALERRRE